MVGRTDARRPLVVVGDALLDVDLVGRADRLAPDAPVPVVAVERETFRPGGAGLAALVGRRLSERPVVLVTPLADDAAGRRLRALLEAEGVAVVPVPHEGATAVKQRVLAQRGPLLRVDRGGEPLAVAAVPQEALTALEGAAAVLVSDYGGGATTLPELRTALAAVTVPVVWDPHPRGTEPVPGVLLATPNEAELRGLTDSRLTEDALPGDGPHEPEPGVGGRPNPVADLAARTRQLVGRWQLHGVAVTLGARGAMLTRADTPPTVVPPPPLPIDRQDPCGAGDCFAVTAALALADGALLPEAVQQAVATASRFVHDGGAGALVLGGAGQASPTVPSPTVPSPAVPSPPVPEPRSGVETTGDGASVEAALAVVERVRAGGGTVVATGGCFDLLHAGHVATLQAARSLGDCLVVLLNSDSSVRRLKGPSRPLQPEHDRARVIAALDAVDAVAVFDEETPIEALRRLRPHVWAKGGDYSVEQMPEAEVVAGWGGEVVVLPYLDGRSTTRLVRLVQHGATTRG